MKEKRISLRFREDNEQDMKDWRILEAVAKERNISKNALAIDLILSSGMHADSADELAERVAGLVANKLKRELIYIPTGSVASGETVSVRNVNTENADTCSRADEPELLGEEALDFLLMPYYIWMRQRHIYTWIIFRLHMVIKRKCILVTVLQKHCRKWELSRL